MKAIVCKEFGPPEKLVFEEFPSRPPGAHEVRTRVHAAGVNFPDVLVIQKSARIEGDVSYDALTIEEGAQVDGKFNRRAAELKLMIAGGTEAI